MSLPREFRLLWAGNAAGNLSDGLIFIALPLVAAALTKDALLIAGLSAVYAGVRLFVVLPIGGLVDHWNRRTILWATNLARAVVLGILAAMLALGVGSIPALYVAIAIVGILEVAADNAALSILPAIVRSRDLDAANSRISAAQLIADEFVGPPLGGLLFGLAIALPISAASAFYAVAGIFFLALPLTRAKDASTAKRLTHVLWHDVLSGVRWLWNHRLLGPLAMIGCVASVGYMMPFSVLVIFAQDHLGTSATGYGVILAVSALGGLFGSVVTARIRNALGYRWTIVSSLLLGSLSMAALALTTLPWVAALLLAAYIFHSVLWGICVSSIRQRLVPDRFRGRVNAATKLLGLVGLTVGAALGGVLASRVDIVAPFVASAAAFLVCAVAALVVLRPRTAD